MSNPPSDYFVDPAIAANTGTGTIGDPYGDLQHALDSVTRNTTDGDRFNIKAGTNEGLSAALSLVLYGTPAFTAPLLFQGYTAAQGDGGQGLIDCNANTVITNAGTCINWYDIEMYDGPAAGALLSLAQYSSVIRCYIHDSNGHGIDAASNNTAIVGTRFEDLGDGTHDMLIASVANCRIFGNYFKQGGARTCRTAITTTNNTSVVQNNIISVDGASNGIDLGSQFHQLITGNTILSGGGSGSGVVLSGTNSIIANILINNYVEGFSGAGGVGFDFPTDSGGGGVYGQNAAYNNTINYDVNSEHYLALGDNEVLTSSGLTKSGLDTFANRFEYFKPANSGNMRTGGYSEA